EDESRTEDYVQGIPRSPGVVRGEVGFETTPLEEFERRPIVLAVNEAHPGLPDRLRLARAALAKYGEPMSHLASACRAWRKPCVVGLNQLEIDSDGRCLRLHDRVIPEFAEIILSGDTGRLYLSNEMQTGYRVKKEHSERVRRVAGIV